MTIDLQIAPAGTSKVISLEMSYPGLQESAVQRATPVEPNIPG